MDLAAVPSAAVPSGIASKFPTNRKTTRRVAVRAVALGVIVVIGLAAMLLNNTSGMQGSPHTLTGSLHLALDSDYENFEVPFTPDTRCAGLGGYSDMRAGAQLVVKDEAGKVIGSGTLEQGQLAFDGVGALAACSFAYEVTGLPEVERYQLGMGDRGSIIYSFDELETAEWHVELNLGP